MSDGGPHAICLAAGHSQAAAQAFCDGMTSQVSAVLRRVKCVEHLLAALEAAGVNNARIEIRGDEVPFLDGSARPFVRLISLAGTIAAPPSQDSQTEAGPVRASDLLGRCMPLTSTMPAAAPDSCVLPRQLCLPLPPADPPGGHHYSVSRAGQPSQPRSRSSHAAGDALQRNAAGCCMP